MTATANHPPNSPIRMSHAMRIARRIYIRHAWQVVVLYATIMAVPIAVNVPIAMDLFASDPGDFVQQMSPGGAYYLPVAFNGMLTALLYPFAVTATIVLLCDVISGRRTAFRTNLRRVTTTWLKITQFGLLWYILLRTGFQGFVMLDQGLHGQQNSYVRWLLIPAGVLLLSWWFFAYVAALVKVVVDRCDPLHAATSGSRLALHHLRGFVSIAWRVVVAYAIYALAVLLAFFRFAPERSDWGAVVLVILPIIFVTPYLVLTLGLYMLDRIYSEDVRPEPPEAPDAPGAAA